MSFFVKTHHRISVPQALTIAVIINRIARKP